MFLIMFKTGHALPLTFVRFSRPRISRRPLARPPHHGRGEARGIGHCLVLSSDVYRSHMRTRSSLNRAINTAIRRPHPCPRSSRIQRRCVAAECPKCDNVRAQSAVCPRPRTSREVTRASDRPGPTGGIVQAGSNPHSLRRSRNSATTYVFI